MRRFAVGSFGWLLAHEIRLALRSLGGGKGLFAKALPMILLALLPAIVGVPLAFALRSLPHGPPSPAALAIVGIALLGVTMLMLPNAAASVLRAFHDRNDLDLLLAAPVPPTRVLAAKSVGLYVGVAGPFVFLLAPFLIASAVLGHPRWLGGLAMILVVAVLATALAFVVARILYRLLGPRRARVVVQIGSGLLGAAVFLAVQARNIAPEQAARAADTLTHLGAPPPPFDWPARAALGAPGPLLAMLGLGALGAWGAARIAAGVLAEPMSDAPRARVLADDLKPKFRSGLTRIVVTKELRLLARDPEILAKVTLRLVFLIPVMALVFRGADGFDGARLASATTFFAGLLASSLAWLTIAAEDAPELLASAPVPGATVARAKRIAACAPPLVVAAVPALFAAARDPWAGLIAMTMAIIAALTGAALQQWYGKPAPRSTFMKRQRGAFATGLGEMLMAGGWAGTALLLARGSALAVLPALLAGGIFYAAADARSYRDGIDLATKLS